jgi:hypothetical protein
MYYPFLRGKQYELLALRELITDINSSGCILPIIEPVKDGASHLASYSAFSKEEMEVVIITNPEVGDFRDNPGPVKKSIIKGCFEGSNLLVPALYINASTQIKNIDTFCNGYLDYKKALVYDFEPHEQAMIKYISKIKEINYHIFFSHRPAQEIRDNVRNKILVTDYFNKADKNASYCKDEFFCSKISKFPIKNYIGFGDYSIVGKDFSEGGWAAYAVALHHVYINNKNDDLYIRHYVSDRTESDRDQPGKFLEALTKLIKDLSVLGDRNNTSTVSEYKSLFAEKHSPGLGYAKKLAIKHHFEIIMKCMSKI